jgi:hypothetical protein
MNSNFNTGALDTGVIPAEVLLTWETVVKTSANPLGVTSELVEKSLEKCPPKEFKGAKWIGRFIIPTSFVKYIKEDQTRDKESDPRAVQELTTDYSVNGILLDKPPPVAAFDPQFPQDPKGLSGYGRKQTYENLGQDIYFYDIYDFTGPYEKYYKEVVRNITNHHKGVSRTQTKHDYIKAVSKAVAEEIVPNIYEEIVKYVDEVAADKPANIRKGIVKEVCASNKTYANFTTYSSQRSAKNINSLYSFLNRNHFVPAGIENRTYEDIQKQGYVVYCAASGDNQSTWARAVTNSVKYGVPVYILGYSDHRVDDLETFRTEWIENFNSQKDIMVEFAQTLLGDTNAEIDYDNFPIKVGGFLPQYVKPNPNDKGAPTEIGVVDQFGKTIQFTPQIKCLSL